MDGELLTLAQRGFEDAMTLATADVSIGHYEQARAVLSRASRAGRSVGEHGEGSEDKRSAVLASAEAMLRDVRDEPTSVREWLRHLPSRHDMLHGLPRRLQHLPDVADGVSELRRLYSKSTEASSLQDAGSVVVDEGVHRGVE